MERKLMRTPKFVFLLLALTLFTTACTREAKNSTKISIKFPEAASSLNISHSVSALSTKWQLSDPSLSNQLNCFAVAVETQSGGNSCYTTAGNILARPAVIHGAFASGTEQSIEVPSGSERKIILIGFQTSNAALCKDVNSSANGLDPANFSAPFILDAVTMDLPANQTVAVNLTIPASLPVAGKFEECAPYMFGRSGSGATAPLTITAIAPTSGSISGNQTVTITGTGFDATTTVSIGGSPCTAVVATATTISCSTPVHGAGVTDVVLNRGPAASTLSSAYTFFATPALLSISLAEPYIFGTLATGGNITQTFTLTNSGDTTATALAGAGLAAPYTFYTGSFPGTGTCTATLPPLGSCTFLVNFAPTTTGAHNDSIDISYHDGTTNQLVTRTVQGAGATPANLTISNTGFDFGLVATGSVNEVTLTITNTGNIPAASLSGSGLAAPFTFKGGTFPGSGGTCVNGGSLAPAGATCTIIVVYSPGSTGTQSDTVDISYNDGVGAQMASNTIQGTGAAPAVLSLSDGPSYDYGSGVIGAPATSKSFTISNSGSVSASNIVINGISAPYVIAGGTCGLTLAGGATCTVNVDFTPAGSGPYNQNLTVTYDDGATTGLTVQRAITGTGTSPAALSISDVGYTFPMQILAGTVDKTFTITNTGGATATSMNGYGVSAPFSFKGGSYPGTGGTCGVNLAGSATCTIVLTFAPSADGTFNDSLDIDYNTGITTDTVSRAFSGTADVTPPVATTFTSPISGTTNADLIPITIVFSEPVAANFTAASLYSAQGTIVNFSGSGNTYQAVFAPTATHPSVQLTIPGYGSQDLAGNWQPSQSTVLTWNFTMPQGQSSLTGLPSAPPAARHPAAVWLGASWFVWGGADGSGALAGGAIYNPGSNAWNSVPAAGSPPSARDRATAGYDGKNVFVWGGNSVSPVGDGALFNTALNSWSPASNTGAPSARYAHTMVAHGNTFIVWGGKDSGGNALNSGGMYNSATNSWTATPTAGAPTGRFHHAAVLAGNRMLVWGGNNGLGSILQHGARLHLGISPVWFGMSTTGQPSAREDFSYVWTGSKLIVWGGSGPGATLLNDGAIYDPETDTWTTIANTGDVPTPRAFAQAVWTGTHMIISGGQTANGPSSEHFALDPVNGSWLRLRSSLAEPRKHHVAVWTGSKMVEFGGEGPGATYLNSGNVLDPMFNGIRVKDIAAGDAYNCAISEAGKVKCWGLNSYGGLGLGNITNMGSAGGQMGGSLPYVNLGTGKSALKVSVGDGFACALLNDHSVKCWGLNTSGQLGLGDLVTRGDGAGEMGDSLPSVNLGGQRAIDISAGTAHACAVTEFGMVKCWGDASGHQLGSGSTTDSSTPITVSGISNGAIEVIAADLHTCVRLFDGVQCWGTNIQGQLGDGTTTLRTSPTVVPALAGASIRKLVGRGGSMCAALPAEWRCWGDNAMSALGDGTSTNRTTPTFVSGTSVTTPTLAMGGSHACAIDSGQIKCWGNNLYGQLGVNTTTSSTSMAAPLITWSGSAVGLSAGFNSNCAWYADGTVRCWGQGVGGRLGMGSTQNYGDSGGYPMSALTGIPLF